ncbi:hypothetical protein CLF_107137 [Clonorchis sinensis]|uniref:Uncharacterized protein n=1 Tax=Clonorchis sinensis TaxID=79923 RepID=G7YG74_CLOSI|nr:hypothetical protein CLF_107137 [Clonorchis sinensis]
MTERSLYLRRRQYVFIYLPLLFRGQLLQHRERPSRLMVLPVHTEQLRRGFFDATVNSKVNSISGNRFYMFINAYRQHKGQCIASGSIRIGKGDTSSVNRYIDSRKTKAQNLLSVLNAEKYAGMPHFKSSCMTADANLRIAPTVHEEPNDSDH